MRCIACDAVITDTQARAKDGAGQPTELCHVCDSITKRILRNGMLPEGHSAGELWQPGVYGLDHTGKGTYVHPNRGKPVNPFKHCIIG